MSLNIFIYIVWKGFQIYNLSLLIIVKYDIQENKTKQNKPKKPNLCIYFFIQL